MGRLGRRPPSPLPKEHKAQQGQADNQAVFFRLWHNLQLKAVVVASHPKSAAVEGLVKSGAHGGVQAEGTFAVGGVRVGLAGARRKRGSRIGDKAQVINAGQDEEAKADHIEVIGRSVGGSRHRQAAVERNVLPSAKTAYDGCFVGGRAD